jgi:hypothetical protein
MRTFAVAFAAAAAMLFAMPTFTSPAAADPAIKLAQADINVRVGPGGVRVRGDVDRHRHRHYRHRHYRHGHGHGHYGRDHCRTTVVIRDGRRTTIRRCR